MKLKQAIANMQITGQNGFELPVSDKPFIFRKRKLLQDFTINCLYRISYDFSFLFLALFNYQ